MRQVKPKSCYPGLNPVFTKILILFIMDVFAFILVFKNYCIKISFIWSLSFLAVL